MLKKYKRVLVTGAGGFLAQNFFRVWQEQVPTDVDLISVTHKQYDLRNPAAVIELFQRAQPDLVIHLAARVGGIGANQKHPATFFYDNMVMGLNILTAAAQVPGSRRVVLVGTTCSYPKHAPKPYKEESLFDGFPEATNAAYGIAKRALIEAARAFQIEHGLDVVTVIPANLYGPYDHFWTIGSAHVIPDMIRKFEFAKRTDAGVVDLWGTGCPTREFLHARDAAVGILLAAEQSRTGDTYNLGSGEEITILNLAKLIAKEIGYRWCVRWDSTKPDGQPGRVLDSSKAELDLGFKASISLQEGIRETIEWYRPQFDQNMEVLP